MRGPKKTFVVTVSDSQRAQLQRWLRSTTLSAGLARRARLILLLDEGRTYADAAQTAGLTIRNARKWAVPTENANLSVAQPMAEGKSRSAVAESSGRIGERRDPFDSQVEHQIAPEFVLLSRQSRDIARTRG